MQEKEIITNKMQKNKKDKKSNFATRRKNEIIFLIVLFAFPVIHKLIFYVGGNINFLPHFVGKFYTFPHFLGGKVIRRCSERKTFSPYINGICTVFKSYFQFVQITGRCQQFNLLHNYCPFTFLLIEPHRRLWEL